MHLIRTRRLTASASGVTLAALLITGCSAPSTTTTPSTSGAPAPIDGTWYLTGYRDTAGEHPVPDGVRPAILLTAGRIGIDAQCNAISGTVSATAESMTVTDVVGTLMYCDGPRAEMERLLTDTLTGTLGYSRDGSALMIDGATTTLTFAATPNVEDPVTVAPSPSTSTADKNPVDPSASTFPADPLTVPPVR